MPFLFDKGALNYMLRRYILYQRIDGWDREKGEYITHRLDV